MLIFRPNFKGFRLYPKDGVAFNIDKRNFGIVYPCKPILELELPEQLSEEETREFNHLHNNLIKFLNEKSLNRG